MAQLAQWQRGHECATIMLGRISRVFLFLPVCPRASRSRPGVHIACVFTWVLGHYIICGCSCYVVNSAGQPVYIVIVVALRHCARCQNVNGAGSPCGCANLPCYAD